MTTTQTGTGGVEVASASFRYATQSGEVITPYGVTELSLVAKPGTVTLLCGPSGCGKTTALRMINGLAPHFHPGELEGTITVGGINLHGAPLHDSGAISATVFQNPRTQFFTPTVLAELAFGPENLGVDPQLIRTRIAAAVATTKISHLLNRRLSDLSGGELQRVACACALVAGVDTLLFDEPTSNLSALSIAELRATIADLKAGGHTIVVAEHRLHFLRGLADQVLLFHKGKVDATFSGEEFFAMSDTQRRAAGLRRLSHSQLPIPPAPPVGNEGLHLRDIRFSYGQHQVLDLPAMTFPAGKITVLTGPNGIGKSTLARLLCGLAQPEKGGTITLGSQTMTARTLRRDGYIVMQDTGRQLFAAAVEDEVTLGLSKQRRNEVDVEQVLVEFDLAGLRDRHPHSLSGGQRQRLVIATASVQHKRIHILDEPTSGVGLAHLTTISQRMRALADSGAVVIVITHDDELIAECADFLIDLADPQYNRVLATERTGP